MLLADHACMDESRTFVMKLSNLHLCYLLVESEIGDY